MNNNSDMGFVKSGMVAIIGPPNAGKSTLMNFLLGQKISIVTSKPQTTRNRILGVLNSDQYQIVLIDTPGIHRTKQPLNKEMVRIAFESLNGVDVILFLVDANAQQKHNTIGQIDLNQLVNPTDTPIFLVINKIDLLEKNKLLPMVAKLSEQFNYDAIVPISAKQGSGTTALIDEILIRLPIGPRYFPEDVPTDVSERFLVGEIIREKVFLLTGQEIPYSSAVLIDAFIEEENLVTIHSTIVIERASQKGIIIGKGGKKLKAIGIQARKDIEKMLGQKVLLKLWVKVKKNWSQNEKFLREIGF